MAFWRKKYWNKKSYVDWYTFDSIAEWKRYTKLKVMQDYDEISDLELQPKFILQEAFERNWKKISAVTYIADFRYVEDGEIIVEDVKGVKTKEYEIKKRLFLKVHGENIIFLEIKEWVEIEI